MFKKGNNCEKHPNENLIYGQICWSCYQENFKESDKYNELKEFLFDLQIYYYNAYIQPTYRTQNSQDWTVAKQAFEQDLIDQNIDWFVYIKFYINNINEINPLVVGKSGSLNVNSSGSDLNFSENEEDGPSRRFLKEENYQWYKTQILIIPTNNEQEAFDIEKEIRDKYNLFYS